MRRVKVFVFIIVLSLIYLTINVNSAFMLEKSNPITSAYKNENLLRLHVIANSNSPQDQYIKRRVRDEVNRYIYENEEINENNIYNKTKDIENNVNTFLKDNNINYSSEVELGIYHFPKRTYGNIKLPSGEYKAFKITLGEGKGANWWCVLLPPVCVETEDENLDGDERNIKIREPNRRVDSNKLVKFKLKSAEILNVEKFKDLELLQLDSLDINILKPEIFK